MKNTAISCHHLREPVKIGRFVVTCSSGNLQGRNTGPYPDFGVYLDSGWRTIVAGHYPTIIVNWPDIQAITLKHLGYLVDFCLKRMRQGMVIDIGCLAGHGRTGTLLASLIARVEHLDGATALREARRRYCIYACETRDQRELVINYAKRYEQMQRTISQIIYDLLDREGILPATEIAKRLFVNRGTACSARDRWKKARKAVPGPRVVDVNVSAKKVARAELSPKDQKAFEQRLDFRPKCPIVQSSEAGRQNECGGDRCAWWLNAEGCCAVVAIARGGLR